MKFTAALLLLVALFAIGSAAKSDSPFCLLCSGLFNVPQDWPSAQTVLIMGCDRLGNAKTSCQNLVRAADLTASYPNMLPHIVQLKDIGCQKYCL